MADGEEEITHGYEMEGRFIITATDKNEPGRTRTVVVSVPVGS